MAAYANWKSWSRDKINKEVVSSRSYSSLLFVSGINVYGWIDALFTIGYVKLSSSMRPRHLYGYKREQGKASKIIRLKMRCGRGLVYTRLVWSIGLFLEITGLIAYITAFATEHWGSVDTDVHFPPPPNNSEHATTELPPTTSPDIQDMMDSASETYGKSVQDQPQKGIVDSDGETYGNSIQDNLFASSEVSASLHVQSENETFGNADQRDQQIASSRSSGPTNLKDIPENASRSREEYFGDVEEKELNSTLLEYQVMHVHTYGGLWRICVETYYFGKTNLECSEMPNYKDYVVAYKTMCSLGLALDVVGIILGVICRWVKHGPKSKCVIGSLIFLGTLIGFIGGIVFVVKTYELKFDLTGGYSSYLFFIACFSLMAGGGSEIWVGWIELIAEYDVL